MPLKDQIRLVFHAVLSGSKDVPRYIVAYHYTRAIIYKGKPLYVSFYGILIEIQKQSLVFCSVGLGTDQDDAGCFGVGPKTAWDISGQLESSTVQDLLGPKKPGPARDQH